MLRGQAGRLLRERHSPEQIACMLRRMHPETIYAVLYAIPCGELRTELIGGLRQTRKSRRRRARVTDRRGAIPHMISIHLRPPKVAERVIPGHWAGDLVKGARNPSAIGALVERSGLLVTLANMGDASANPAITGFSAVLNRIDAQRCLSITDGQGQEMAQHERLFLLAGATVYFADPHSPCQRGIHENTHGLLRQYFPKGTDLAGFSHADLDATAWQLNTHPRKTLGWKCPAEIFMPDSFNFFEHHHQLVVLRT